MCIEEILKLIRELSQPRFTLRLDNILSLLSEKIINLNVIKLQIDNVRTSWVHHVYKMKTIKEIDQHEAYRLLITGQAEKYNQFIRLKNFSPEDINQLCAIDNRLYQTANRQFVFQLYTLWQRRNCFDIETKNFFAQKTVLDYPLEKHCKLFHQYFLAYQHLTKELNFWQNQILIHGQNAVTSRLVGGIQPCVSTQPVVIQPSVPTQPVVPRLDRGIQPSVQNHAKNEPALDPTDKPWDDGLRWYRGLDAMDKAGSDEHRQRELLIGHAFLTPYLTTIAKKDYEAMMKNVSHASSLQNQIKNENNCWQFILTALANRAYHSQHALSYKNEIKILTDANIHFYFNYLFTHADSLFKAQLNQNVELAEKLTYFCCQTYLHQPATQTNCTATEKIVVQLAAEASIDFINKLSVTDIINVNKQTSLVKNYTNMLDELFDAQPLLKPEYATLVHSTLIPALKVSLKTTRKDLQREIELAERQAIKHYMSTVKEKIEVTNWTKEITVVFGRGGRKQLIQRDNGHSETVLMPTHIALIYQCCLYSHLSSIELLSNKKYFAEMLSIANQEAAKSYMRFFGRSRLTQDFFETLARANGGEPLGANILNNYTLNS